MHDIITLNVPDIALNVYYALGNIKMRSMMRMPPSFIYGISQSSEQYPISYSYDMKKPNQININRTWLLTKFEEFFCDQLRTSEPYNVPCCVGVIVYESMHAIFAELRAIKEFEKRWRIHRDNHGRLDEFMVGMDRYMKSLKTNMQNQKSSVYMDIIKYYPIVLRKVYESMGYAEYPKSEFYTGIMKTVYLHKLLEQEVYLYGTSQYMALNREVNKAIAPHNDIWEYIDHLYRDQIFLGDFRMIYLD